MKQIILAAMVLTTAVCTAQDVITARYNATITGTIISTEAASITYKKPDNPATYVMDKGDIKEIRYADGRTESFESDIFSQLPLEETKSRIASLIAAHGYVHEKDRTRYKANWLGDKLQILEVSDSGKDKNGTAVTYDFAQVPSFNGVSKREGDVGYLNIWVMGSEKENATKLEKRKFVILCEPQHKAYELLNLFKHLNKLLKK